MGVTPLPGGWHDFAKAYFRLKTHPRPPMSSSSLRAPSHPGAIRLAGIFGVFALVALILAPAVALAQISVTGPLTLVETGGSFASGNLAPSRTAFAQDEIGVAPHAVAKVNDGAYGNASSWIGAGPNSFIGISLGATPVVLHRVAFGRDNTGALTDRTTGLYTLQYTAAPSPSAATPESDWVTIGTLNYPPADPTFSAPWLRRVFQFPQVVATGFRIKVASAGSAIALDEMELYSPPNGLVVTGRGLALVAEGGSQRSAHNLALASAGATPFAKDSLATPPHALANLNDGVFGNPSSWIAGSADTFVGVSLGATPVPVARVAFGRDNTGALTDRALGAYTLQYTTVPSPGAATPDSAWITLGTLDYQQPGGLNFAQPARRHEFAFPAVEATGLRLRVVTSGGLLAQVGIDEFEVYGPPRLRVAQPGGITRTLANRVALWGDNSFGQLNIPADLTSPRFLEVGRFHVATLDATGAYRGWSTYQTALAADPAARTGLKAVAAGTSHNIVIQSDGTAAVWGSAAYGAPASPPPPALAGVAVRSVAAGYFFSVARTATGEVVAWGDDSSGQTRVPAGLAGVRAIDAGENHVLALKNDGTVVAWGDNTYGQRNVPAGLANVRAVAAGLGHALALKEDGTVVAWGINDKGQTNVPAGGLAHVKAIAAGDGHSAALLEDDSIVLWGANTSGQLTPPSALADRAFVRTLSLGGLVSGALYAAPAPYLFGQAAPGGQLTRTFTVTNDGGSPLALNAPALVGGASARFSLDASALPASLAPGQSATFAVTFTPSDTATAATRLVLKSDDPETPAFVFAVSANLADTAAPVITPPADIALIAATGAGAAASFSYRVTDDFDPAPAVVVSRPSGGIFPIGVTTVTITATDASGNASTATFTVTVSPPPIVLVETGGSFAPANLARTGAAFALNEIGIAPHTIGAVNDGVYGNASSWIAGTLNSFVGISFGATPVPVRAIAFGRDNTGGQTTRAAGTYTLQFTTTPNPGAATPDSAWVTLGSFTLPGPFLSPERRHLFSFLPVEATGVRLRVQSTDFGIGLDEIELYTAVPAPTLAVEQPAGTALIAGSGAIDFGAHEAGAAVPARVVTLRNTGDRPLAITQIVHFGEGSTSYALTTSSTSLNLAPGASTTFGLSFSATGLGARAATLRITTDDPATPVFDVALAGEVRDTAAPVIAAYADVVADATSASGVVVNFAAPTVTDASGLPVTVVFSPAGGGLFSLGVTPVTLTATDAAGNSSSRVFQVQVVGRARAAFQFADSQSVPGTPPTLDFGQVALGSGANRSLLVRNTGLVPLTVTSAALTGAHASDFGGGLAGLPFTLGVGESRTLELSFNPAAHGARSASLVLATTDPAPASYTLLLAGSGLDNIAPVLSPLPDITASTSSASGLRVLFPAATVTDNGAAPVSVAYSAASGSLFPIGSTPVTVTATDDGGNVASSSFVVRIVAGSYPPEVPVGGTVPANLALGRPAFAKDELGGTHLAAKINDRAYGNPSSWIGAGLQSFVGVKLGSTPVAINRVAFSRDHTDGFGDRVAAEYVVQYTTVPDPGAATPDAAWVTVGSVTYFGAFANPNRRTLYGFAEVQATGLRIVTRSVGLPVAIDELEIHGPAGALSVADSNATPLVSGVASVDFGSLALGTTSTSRMFTLGNPGAYPLTVNTAAPVGAQAGDFLVTPSTSLSVPIAPGGSVTLAVAFRPIAPGSRQAVLRIESPAAGSPFEIALGGEGVDSLPPQITPPANRVVVVADPALTGAVVTYPSATVTDNSGVPPSVTYSHPSGGFFPRGLTTVTVTATDASGNSSTAAFTVSVLAHSPLGLEDSAGNPFSVGRAIRQWGGSSPVAPANLNNVVDVVLNEGWGMALLDDGTVAAWGNSGGVSQLPVGLNSVVAISGGPSHGLALKADGTVVAWGFYYNVGSAYVPAGLNQVVSIAAAYNADFAIKADGTIVSWGRAGEPLLAVPNNASPAIGVESCPADYVLLALRSGGSVVGWGSNQNSQLTIPIGAGGGVKQISVGNHHVLALKDNGTVVGWGVNLRDELTGISDATGIAEVRAGANISLARRTDGTVFGTGINGFAALTAAQGLEDVLRLANMKSDSAAAVVRSWPELALGSVAQASSATRTLTLRNHGLTPLRVTGLSLTGPDAALFSVNGAGVAAPIPPGGTAAVPITFAPQSALGLKNATLRIDSEDPIEPYWKVRLTGTAADITPPVLGALPDIVAPVSTPTSRTVTFAPTATDNSGVAPTITTVPASGSLFPLGNTTVQVTATDASGNTATGSFIVTVLLDVTPPIITAPAGITAHASSSAGVSVLFAPVATDNTGLPPVVATTPASGALFPLGETTVTATATDSAGNVSSSVTFKVTVLPATDLADVAVGAPVPANLATGKTPFAQDAIGIAPHSIAALTDGAYGNASSWIAGALESFAGVNLGATPVLLDRIAFGRDHTGVQTTRAEGVYTVQYTTVPNPGAATPDSAWQTLGAVQNPGTLAYPTRRNLFAFAPVAATGVRIRASAPVFAVGIDEIELYAPALAPTPSQLWRNLHFGTIDNAGPAADLADPDGDGVVNLLEYAFGLDPTSSAQRVTPATQLATGYLQIRFTPPTGVDDVLYGAEWSTTLATNSWQAVPDTGAAPERLFRVPISGQTRVFLRLVVTRPAP